MKKRDDVIKFHQIIVIISIIAVCFLSMVYFVGYETMENTSLSVAKELFNLAKKENKVFTEKGSNYGY